MDKGTAYKVVLLDLARIDMFRGIYDAKQGSKAFMSGIEIVMSAIADNADAEWFTEMFMENVICSERGE